MSRYKVTVDDNFHYMEEDERYEVATFSTIEEAIAACKRIVDDNLSALAKGKNYTPDELYDDYMSFGSDPFIVALDPKDDRPCFSAWAYAKERSQVLSGQKNNRRVKRSSLLIPPESFEPIRRECSVSRRVLDVLVPEIRLERARIMAVIRQFVTTSVAEHVGMDLDPEFRANRRPFDHTREKIE